MRKTIAIGILAIAAASAGAAFAAPRLVGELRDGLTAPTSLAVSEDRIAALEPFAGRLVVFSAAGVKVSRVDIAGDAIGLARLDGDAYLFCDRERSGVVSIDAATGVQGDFAGPFADPMDVCVSGGKVHVLEAAGRIVTCAPDGTRLTSVALVDASGAPLGLAASFDRDPVRGVFHVLDQLSSRIHVFDAAGGHLGSYCGFGAVEGTVTRGGDLACDAAGYVYVADRYQGRVAIFDPAGVFATFVEPVALGGDRLSLPVGVAVGRDGLLYAAAAEGAAVQVFDPGLEGAQAAVWVALPMSPADLDTVPVESLTLVAQVVADAGVPEGLGVDFDLVAADDPASSIAFAARLPVAAPVPGAPEGSRPTASWSPGDRLEPGRTYGWSVRARLDDAVGEWSARRWFRTAEGPPALLRLEQNYPNPFNPMTTVPFHAPAGATVALEICDIKGQVVLRRVFTSLPGGRHEFVWNGLDEDGAAVASGIYFYRLSAGGETRARKMVLVR